MMILQTLRRQPRHGYAIAKTIKESSADLLAIEDSSLYPALQRMLRAKWVKAEWGLSARNRRVRIYTITAKGRKQLEEQYTSYERMLQGIGMVMKAAEEGAGS